MAPDGLSDRQFRRKVFEELQNAGTIDGLKGTLRSRLVGVLQRRDPGVFASSGPEHQTLWQRAANSLYVEYLASQNYGYSLSVFQPECGLTNQQVMTREELSRVLSLNGPIAGHLPASPTSDAPGAPPLLVSLLQGVADMGGAGARREIQTQTDDDGGNSSLSLRLAQIDEMHERAVETERAAPLRDAEARMAAFQKECESRLRAEMEEQVRRVRDHEVGQARLEEAAKHRRQIKEAREELERVHAERLRKLRAREESQTERVRAAEASLERAAFDHRQRLAAEHEALREAKAAAQQEEAARVVRRAREDEQLARREAEMASKEQQWATRYAELSAQAEMRASARRLETDSEAERRLQTVTAEMSAISDERAKLEADRAAHAAELAALARARREAAEARQNAGDQATATDILEAQLRDARAQLDAARDALEKRGVPLPVGASDVGAGGIGMGLAMNAGVARGAVSPGAGGPAYSQLVAATERAKAETQLARAEIAQRRGDLARIKRERNTAMAERGDAVREAAEWKGKCELANAMLDEAVRRAEETWATMQDTKATMRVMLDEERDKRVQAEAAAAAFRTAAEIPGVTAVQLGLRSSLDDDVKARAGTEDSPTVNVLRLQQLEHQQEMQRSALDQYKRKLMYERQAQEASAAVAAADLVAIRRADAARAKAEQEKHKFYVAESAAAGAREEEPESAEKPASPKAVSPKAASPKAVSPKPASPEPASPKQEDAAEAKRRSEAAAALEADRKKREALSAKIAAAQAAPAAAPAAPAAPSPAKAKSPRTTGSDEIEEVIEEYDDEFVPEELDEDAEADLSMPADSDFDKSFQGKSGSGDSVF
jgi:oral-facial-digital syndrome 1 protein